tara:strand:- start:1042 stop:2394 length:1353 start_codon:yes stop_codon:yes gene_type:complete
MAATNLQRTPGTSGNRNKWTFSAWVKRSSNTSEQAVFSAYQSNDYYTFLRFEANGTIKFRDNYTGNANLEITTDAMYKDTFGWYNIVAVYDKDNATSADKAILYVNGERVVSLSQSTMPSNASTWNVSNVQKQIGSLNTGQYWNGSMSHIHFSDGYAYGPEIFGETDSSTGEWKIKTEPSLTYGSNGFFILKDDNSGTDQSPNTNNFAVGTGTLTKTEDCPSNVFPTFNMSLTIPNASFIENGALMAETSASGNYLAGMSSLGMPRGTGIYYCEMKLIAESATGESCIGVCSEEAFTLRDAGTLSIVGADYNWGIRNNNGLEYYDGLQGTSKHGNFAPGDIMGVYFDSTNDKLTFSKNGGWWNGTSSWTGTSPDLTNYFVGTTSGTYKTFFFNCGDSGNTVSAKWAANFGNGYFGQNAISSAGTNASGNGIFEFDTPTGARALSTKGLNL